MTEKTPTRKLRGIPPWRCITHSLRRTAHVERDTVPPPPIDPDVADIDFAAVPGIRRHSQIERSKRTRSLLARVGGRAPEAIGILGLHKHELIALVRTHGVADGREPAGAVEACG